MGLGREAVRASPDHKFLVCRSKLNSPIWKRADELKVHDYVAIGTYQESHKGSIPLVKDNTQPKGRREQLRQPDNPYKVAYLAGWFAAEGHYHAGLVFNLGINELERAQIIRSLINEQFGLEASIKTPPYTPNDSTICVEVYSKNLEEYFKEYFVGYNNKLGRGVGKFLREWILYAPPDIQMCFLKGWLLEDDGLWQDSEVAENVRFRRTGNRNRYKYTGTTASETMAWQIYHMALRCNLHPCIKKRRNNRDIYFSTIADTSRLLNIKIEGRVCKRRFWKMISCGRRLRK